MRVLLAEAWKFLGYGIEEWARAIGAFLAIVTGSTYAVYKGVSFHLRRTFRKNVEKRQADSSDPHNREAFSLRDPRDTGQFLVTLLEPELKRQGRQYGERLEDLRGAFDRHTEEFRKHIEEAKPAMADITTLKAQVRALEALRQEDIASRRADKAEILDAIRANGTTADQRFGRIEGFLRARANGGEGEHDY